MPCQSCIDRQRKLVKLLCKNPNSKWCQRAKARLDRILGAAKKA
jgi:hypothetical protein